MKQKPKRSVKYCDKPVSDPPSSVGLNNNFRDALLGSNRTETDIFNKSWPKLAGEEPKKYSTSNNVNVYKGSLSTLVSISAQIDPLEISYVGSNLVISSENSSFEDQTKKAFLERGIQGESSNRPLIAVEFPSLGDIHVKKKQKNLQVTEPNSHKEIVKTEKQPGESSKAVGVTKSTEKQNKPSASTKSTKSKPAARKTPSLRNKIKIDVLEAIQLAVSSKLKAQKPKKQRTIDSIIAGNPLDSDRPLRRKGKVRAVPKKKNLTKIKKAVILSRQKCAFIRNLKLNDLHPPKTEDNIALEEDLEKSVTDLTNIVKKTNFLNPVRTENPPGVEESEMGNIVKLAIHTKKFRPYCRNTVTKEFVNLVKDLVTSLRIFQDRLHQRDPMKAKRKRRYVCGFKEAIKFLHTGEIKMMIIATNLEVRVGDPLEKMIEEIKSQCNQNGVPIIFAGTSQDLGYWTLKKNRISIIGVLSYQGCEAVFKELLDCLEKAQLDYDDKVRVAKLELGLEDTDETKKVEELIKASMLQKLSEKDASNGMQKAELCHLSSYLNSVERCLDK